MPGGDKAATEPWRMGLSWLYHCLGPGVADLDTPLVRMIDPEKTAFLIRMMDRRINCPLTSSCGRLFDAVAAILGIGHHVTFESQAAMALEALSTAGDGKGYGVDVQTDETGMLVMDFSRAILGIVDDLASGLSIPFLGGKFHNTVVDGFVRSAARVGEQAHTSKAVLSGGVFNNRIVLRKMTDGLRDLGFTVYSHTRVPCGDGGISLGQAAVAGAIKRNKGGF
jgi:hydrogenase maturation protein HypF